MAKTLIIGACGQIGTELVLALRKKYENETIIASDIRESIPDILANGPYIQLDILNRDEVRKYIIDQKIEHVYLLAALLSATAEKNPDFAWKLNMEGLFTILDLAKEGHINRIFWPSSIAVFGPTTPSKNTPQQTIMEPSTVYGISKLAGENWCAYYHSKFGVDVRSIRYPGLISYNSLPGGGTTDYAVDIFYSAKEGKEFSCFLGKDTELPMMFMDDAIRATLELMNADSDKISVRTSYNVAGCSFTPEKISEEIKKHLPEFKISYNPDFRQNIAETWPSTIDDSVAKKDWNWICQYNLTKIVSVMVKKIKIRKNLI
ncbi:MAG: NAD-dependent epimerase/dehydratase family protein [Bacteroidetes bacterium]|nr:NAD-dependent epimerase/dehydratase family protein [Bacteroidota bacterium]